MLKVYFLVACVCVLIVSVLYTFYFNRLVAAVIGFFLRVTYWKRGGSSIWIQLGSVHISILAGRILLKDVVYYSSNQTVKIVKAQVSWRYWLRVPATEDDLNRAHVGGEDLNQTYPLPSCRIKISLQGFEWFLYNRTAAYDYILSQMRATAPPDSEESEPRRLFSRTSGLEGLYPPSVLASIKAPPIIHATLNWVKRQLPYLDPKDLLPISIEVFKLCIVCGNQSTPNLMVAECHRADGTFGIVQARSKCDFYKQLLNFKFQNALIHFVENENYQETMTRLGHSIRAKAETSIYADRIPLTYLSFGIFAKVWRGIRLYSTLFYPLHSASDKHRGSTFILGKKSESLVEDTLIDVDFTKLEYAIERRIVEAPILELSYYADAVGEVPDEPNGSKGMGLESYDIGNGDLPPEWGIDLVIRNGAIRYGPWADRQRGHLHRAFFPPTYHDMEVSQRLKSRDKRAWTALKIFVELREETTLDIPFREASKNWQWDSRARIPKGRPREPMTLHVTAGDSSSISFLIPMVIGPDGYESRLEVHLDTVEVTSSLNDIKVINAESCRVSAALPSPLQWNAKRQWSFSISLRQPILFLLRDHINMITDLSRDWTSGPPTEWNHFVPTVYSLELNLHHFHLNLYVNDQNIIDKPLLKTENTMVILNASRLWIQATIPSDTYLPEATTITYTFDVPDLSVRISLPKWNTQSIYNHGQEHRVLHAAKLRVDGTYHYWAEVHPSNIEQLKVGISASDVSLKALGWAIRYFMVLRDNYFGSFTHFTTLTEYLDKRSRGEVGDPIELKWRPEKTNILQVEVTLTVQNGSLLLPAGLPGFEQFVSMAISSDIGTALLLALPELQLALRLHDYFMEMSLNVGEIRGCIVDACPEDEFFGQVRRSFKEKLVIDGLDITANRLFGPPPRARTYVCVWEVALGDIKALFTPSEARVLLAAIDAFRIHFTDVSNAPASEFGVPLDPDLTFVKLSVKAVNAVCLAGAAAVDLDVPRGLTIHSNDLRGQLCGKSFSLRLPLASLKGLVTSNVTRKSWSEAAAIELDIVMESFTSLDSKGNPQQSFLHQQDILTQRAQYLLNQVKDAQANFRSGQQTSDRSGQPRLPRRVHRSALYLPPLVLPQFRRMQKSNVPQQHQHPSPLPRWSHIFHPSESDGENISEAERDARLARSRIPHAVPADYADSSEQSLSDDESDDADLTDALSFESEWSTHPAEGDERSLLRRYNRSTRHYRENSIENISSWEGSPFTMSRDAPNSNFPRPRDVSKRTSSSLTPSKIDISHASAPKSMTRVQCVHGVELLVTPLVIVLVSRLKDEIEQHDLSAELILDAVFVRHLSDFVSSAKSDNGISSSPALDILVHSVRVQVAEQILMKIDDHGPSSITSRVQGDRSVDLVLLSSLTRLTLKTIPQVQGSLPSTYVQVAFDELSLGLGKLPPATRVVPDSPQSEFCLSVHGFQANHVYGHANFSLRNFMIQMGAPDPEYLISFVLAMKSDAEALLDIFQVWRSQSSASFQTLVGQVLLLTKENAIVDPLSIIQPSYLVQRGLPYAVRTNGPLKFLLHLRLCLRQLERIPSTQHNSETHDMLHLMTTRLSNLMVDLDTPKEMDTNPWNIFFPTDKPLSAKPPSATLSITCDIETFNFCILSVSSKSHSYLTTSALRFRYRPSSLVHLPQSFPPPPPKQLPRHTVIFAIADVCFVASPRLVDFAQGAIRMSRHWQHDVTTDDPLIQAVRPPTQAILLAFVGSMNIRAGAENLTFEVGGSSLDLSSSLLVRPDMGLESTGGVFMFGDMHIRARSKGVDTNESNQDILASLVLTNGKIDAAQRHDVASNTSRVVFGFEEILVSIPRSAIRLYRFVEEWRADFLPGIEATAETLVSEFKRNSMSTVSKPSVTRNEKLPATSIRVNGSIARLGVTLQVMRGTWLSWTVDDTTAFVSSSPASSLKRQHTFGLQLRSQGFSITYKSRSMDASMGIPRVKLILPTLILTGTHNKGNVQLLGALDFVKIMIKPTHIDTLLVVQQKFGQDFTELLDLIQMTRQRSSARPEGGRATRTFGKLVVHVNVKGFRVGLEGPSSVFYLECQDVGGDVVKRDEKLEWKVQLRDLALYLAPRTRVVPHENGFDGNDKSAFVIVDVYMSGSDGALKVTVPKIHAVMQPSSIGVLGDFIDYHQAELISRRQQRATELEAFKEKTRSILKTFESQLQQPDVEKSSWLSGHTISVEIERVGVAFPLALSRGVAASPWLNPDLTVRAFLFCVRRIRFSSQRGEVSQLNTRELSFQFVNRFRQHVPTDFRAESHQTRNRLVYPQMKGQLRSDTSLSKRQMWITASITGFILDLDSSISDCVFSLIDVYRQGRERMERLASSAPRDATLPSETMPIQSPVADERPSAPSSSIFGAFVFESGEVRIHSDGGPVKSSLESSGTFSDDFEDSLPAIGPEVIRLPIVSAWIEYRGSSNASVPQSSILIFKTKIHSSQNTLRPSLLPFLSDITDCVQMRIRTATRVDEHSNHFPLAGNNEPTVSVPSMTNPDLQTNSRLQINFSLRIDRSTLEFTCQPDVNVLAALRWESGGFIVSISPGAHEATFTGSVDGLTVGLKHGFLSEDCINLATRNLVFSLTFSEMEDSDGNPGRGVSLVVSSDISGGVRFSRLQDMLCFKAVWLDRIPFIASRNPPTKAGSISPALPASHVAKQEVTTAIVVRIRSIEVNVDLGQSISSVTLSMEDALVRTRLSEKSRELSLSVAIIAIFAKGNISGSVSLEDYMFHTISRSEEVLLQNSNSARLLELTMTSGLFTAELESEHQRLLVYRADPIQVDIHDDWSLISSAAGETDRPLLLAFTVHGGEIIALATISTIPKLMLYVNKFKANIAGQRLAASRESEAFRVTHAPKPGKPLTQVASVYFQSARTRFKEAEADMSYVVRQQMSFRLKALRLIVFPRSMADTELAQFIGRDVHASLNRTVEDGCPSRREIHLSFSSLDISKFSQHQSLLPSTATISRDPSWILSLFKNPTESNIVGLPSMKMLMITEESVQDLTSRLLYDFYSSFQGRGEKSTEDIYITLNMALYAWLTGLRKNLSREMEHAQGSMSPQVSNPPGPSSRKKGTVPGSEGTSPIIHVEDNTILALMSKVQLGTKVPSTHTPTAEDGVTATETPSSTQRSTQPHEVEDHAPPAKLTLVYEPRERKIQRLTMRQLGEATPDVMHPFFKRSGFNLEESLPQYVHEYATVPLEGIMEALLSLYSRQLRRGEDRDQ